MSRKRVLSDAQCEDLEAWYSNYQRIGTIDEKCLEAGISKDTFRDAVRRVRGEMPRPLKRKLSEAELNQLADEIIVSRGATDESNAA